MTKNQKTYLAVVGGTLAVALPAFGLLADIRGLLASGDFRGLLQVIGFSVVVTLLVLVLRRQESKVAAEYLAGPKQVVDRAAQLLEDSKHSLDYYGGLSLITASEHGMAGWKDALTAKLKASDFDVRRYIDLVSVDELAALYRASSGPEFIAKQVEEYASWIETQCKVLAQHPSGNSFYNMRGAPVWQWGIHVLVFDCKHVMTVFSHSPGNFRALLVRDTPAAEEVHRSLNAWRERLNQAPLSVADLLAVAAGVRRWKEAQGAVRAPVDDGVSGPPSHRVPARVPRSGEATRDDPP